MARWLLDQGSCGSVRKSNLGTIVSKEGNMGVLLEQPFSLTPPTL